MKIIFMSLLLLTSLAFAEEGPPLTREFHERDLVEVKSWEKLNINKRGQTRVYKFVDETSVDGTKIKTLCYVTDKTETWADGAGIYCLKID